MEIKEKMQKALNGQINKELYSGYLYLAMSAYMEDIDLPGAASWMRKQAEEEKEHAMKLFDHIVERGGRVNLEAIENPKSSWSSALEAFEEAYAHEQKVTKMINDLAKLAEEEEEFATRSFLNWFIDEQVEEESSVDEIVKKLKRVKDSSNGLLMVDKELSAR
ncbi:MAG: ferritin [Nanobdellota archaeon]